MRNRHPFWLITVVLAATSCALLTRPYRPPRAPKSEAEKVKFPWGTPSHRVILTGAWLRAMTMALDDFLPAEEAEKKPESELDECLARRENYYVDAWVWSPRASSDAGMDGGSGLDASPNLEQDGGYEDAGEEDPFAQPGMPMNPSVIYVSILLAPGRCDLGESPLVDMGAVYAIDTVNWRILAAR